MAKTKTKDTVKTVEKETLKAKALFRKGALAYIGLHAAAYDRAKDRVVQLRGQADGFFDTLVERGTEIEDKAGTYAKVAQVKAGETFSGTTARVRGILPKASNDRVAELEAEIATLTKKITALSKKTTVKKAASKTKMTTQKTEKAA